MWKYTNEKQEVVVRTLPNGNIESCLVSVIDTWLKAGNTPTPADVVPEDKTPSVIERLAAVEKVLIEKKVLSQEELTTAISVKVKG